MTEQYKPQLKITSEDIIMDESRVWGLISKSKCSFSGFDEYDWEQFAVLYEIDLLKRKPRYSWQLIKQIKKVLEAFNTKLNYCRFHMAPDQPLIIDPHLDFYAILAPKVHEP